MPFLNLNNVPVTDIIEGYHAQFVHTNSMTFSFINVDANSALPLHSHPHEQVSQVIEGKFQLIVNGEIRVLEPGDIAVIPSNTPHSGFAITNCKLLDVFNPVREDYLQKSIVASNKE
jgi:quercetin dioxygenase-like cupin family protein